MGQESFREYLLTVQQATDKISQRQKREMILRGLLQSLFEVKDSQRLFSTEGQRLLWNTTAICMCAKCGEPVTWNDFTIDHIAAYSQGGRTELDTAALMHKCCNASQANKEANRGQV